MSNSGNVNYNNTNINYINDLINLILFELVRIL